MSLLFVAAAAVPSGAEKTLLDYIAQSREVGLLIILLSLFVTAVIIAQLFSIRLARLAPDDQIDEPRPASSPRTTSAARSSTARPTENRSLLTRVLGGALIRCARSPSATSSSRTRWRSWASRRSRASSG
jgi:hypothetical protein